MNIERVTLVVPGELAQAAFPLNSKVPLLGLGYIAAVLEQRGYTVNIIDAYVEKLSAREVFERIIASGTSVVGIPMNLLSYGFASALAAACVDRNIPVIVGGPEVTLNARTVMDSVSADVGVVGEGEEVIVELLQTLESESQWNPATLSKIKGIVFRDSDGSLRATSTRPRISDLDRLPYMPYNMFPMHLYDLRYYPLLPAGPVFPLYTSRGCPFACTFCSSKEIWQRKCVFMSAERVVDELQHIVKTYSPHSVYFHDDHATLKKQRMVDICDGLLKRNIRVSWACMARCEGLDKDLFRLMKRAGCLGMWFGIESGSKRILSLIRKGISLDRVLEVVDAGKRSGLAMGAFIIVGIPTQTKEEERETVRFLEKAKFTFVQMSPYIGYHGSDLYREFLAHGSKYVWSERSGIILPNSEEMTWPQNVEWAERQQRRLNWTPRFARHCLRSLGLIPTVKRTVTAFTRHIGRVTLPLLRNDATTPVSPRVR